MLLFLMLVACQSQAQTMGSFTDSRDGQVYATVAYEFKLDDKTKSTMVWMAENLNYKMEDSYCYDDYDSNCGIMGRLYSWPIAMKACPQGWHLPTDEEWYKLTDLYGGIEKSGTHIKSTSELWQREGQGTNKSVFNAMPYGYGVKREGGIDYTSFERNAIFWSSSEKDEAYAWDWNLVTGWEKVSHSDGHKETILNSVRCVQDGK